MESPDYHKERLTASDLHFFGSCCSLEAADGGLRALLVKIKYHKSQDKRISVKSEYMNMKHRK